MAGDTLDLPSTDTPTTLTPLYPDTQNETARNLTKDDRAGVMQDLQQLILDLKTRRFDPSTVASEKTCKAISKLLPACLDHKEERDRAFEILRTLMISSFDLLKECFIKGGSRNDLKRPNWVFAKDQDEQGRAMENLLSNCFWAVMAFMDAVDSPEVPEAQRNLPQHKAAIAEALFPAFEEYLTGEDFGSFPPIVLRDLLDIIDWCTIDARAAKESFAKFGFKALANIFAYSRDFASCSLAYYLAGRRVENAKEKNQKIAQKLFPSTFYDAQSVQKLRDAWAGLPFDGKAIRKFKFPFHEMLAHCDIRQPQLFLVINKEITVGSRNLNLDQKGFISEGKYLLCLNERSISCSLKINDGYHALDIQLDTLLSCHSDNDNQLTFVTAGMPTTTPQILKHDPSKTIATVIQMEHEDTCRLQEALKYRYVPLLDSRKLYAVKKLQSGPQKISLSQEPIRIRDHSTNSQDSEDSREKMKARAAEYAKIIAGSSPEDASETLQRPLKTAPPSKSTSKESKQLQQTQGAVTAIKPNSKDSVSQPNPPSDDHKSAKQQKTVADTTRMSLGTTPDSDFPGIGTAAPRSKSTSGSEKSVKTVNKPASKTQVIVEITSRRVSVGKEQVVSTDPSIVQRSMQSILPDEKCVDASTIDLSELPSSDEESAPVKSVKKSGKKRKIVRDSESEYEPEEKEKPVSKKKKVNELESGQESDTRVKPPQKKKKARDSGFEDLPKPEKTNVKAKASAESSDDTDYDDLSKAGIEEEKLKTTPAKKGRGAATRLRGRGRGRGKIPPATATKRKARKHEVDEALIEDESEGRDTGKRVTRSRARAKPAVQPIKEAGKNARKNDEQSDEAGENAQVVSEKELSSPLPKRKTPAREAPPSTEADLEYDFFDRSESTKQPKDIKSFSQLVDPKRNPVIASKAKDRQDKPKSATSHPTNNQANPSVRQDKPETSRDTVSPEQAALSAKEINEAFDDLFNETPNNSAAEQGLFEEDIHVPEFQEADQDNEVIRNFTTLYDDHDMQADVYATGAFFVEGEAPVAQAPAQAVSTNQRKSLSPFLPTKSTAQSEAVESAFETMEDATSTEYEEVVRMPARKGKSTTPTEEKVSIVKHEVTRKIETQNSPRSKTSDANQNHITSESSMEVDAIVAESYEQVSRLITEKEVSAENQSIKMSTNVSNNVERQILVESAGETKQQAIEVFDKESEEHVLPRKSASKGIRKTAAIPNKLLEAETADSDAEAQKSTRSARRGRSRAVLDNKILVDERVAKEDLNKTLSPVKTSTPYKGYDEEEHQTQFLEDPLEALQHQPVEDKKRSTMKHSKQQHEVIAKVTRSSGKSDRDDKEDEQPDRLVDLSFKLSMLLVKNHRNELNAYKMSKSTGIDNIINVVATGCHEAEQMDINFIQGMRNRNEELHGMQSKSTSPLRSIQETIKTEKAKIIEETAYVKESKELLKIKLVPDLFSNFKSLQRFKVK